MTAHWGSAEGEAETIELNSYGTCNRMTHFVREGLHRSCFSFGVTPDSVVCVCMWVAMQCKPMQTKGGGEVLWFTTRAVGRGSDQGRVCTQRQSPSCIGFSCSVWEPAWNASFFKKKVFIFSLKYRTGHAENCLLSLSQKRFLDRSIQKVVDKFENRGTASFFVKVIHRWGCPEKYWICYVKNMCVGSTCPKTV